MKNYKLPKSLKIFFLVMMLLFNAFLTIAQDYLYFSLGYSSANVTSKNFVFEGGKNRNCFASGVAYEHIFKWKMSASIGLLYNQRGFESAISTPGADAPTSYFDYNYISLPIKVGYTVGNKVIGFVKVGILPSRLLKAEYTFPMYDNQGNYTGHEAFDKTDVIQKNDFGATAELGGGYKLSPRWIIYTSALYQRSFTNSTTEDYFATSEVRHYGFTLSLGVKYALKI